MALNRLLDEKTATQLADIFIEVVLAPEYDPQALKMLTAKKNIRILTVAPRPSLRRWSTHISGGLLVQDLDRLNAFGDDPSTWTLVSGKAADSALMNDLVFAWRACRSVKSNAILLAKDRSSVGIGMGQVNRVDSCELAIKRAGKRAQGAVAASDAFFPFNDGPSALIEAGIKAIVQPGGSIRDEETIALCRDHDITMYFTKTRHFWH